MAGEMLGSVDILAQNPRTGYTEVSTKPGKLTVFRIGKQEIVKMQEEKTHGFLSSLLSPFIPDKTSFQEGIKLFFLIVLGGAVLSPLVSQLPMLGWDWFYFFNGHNLAYNIASPSSAYPPFARVFLNLLTWMDWRQSLAVLNSITLVTIALATWQCGGRYGSIGLALLTPPVYFLLWIGHPDGLMLLGAVTGFIPLVLIKPQVVGWSLLKSRSSIFWTVVLMATTLMIWGLWPLNMLKAPMTHEAAFGWAVTGWPIAVLGLVLLIGAGSDMYRLMATGCLMSPHLMPYHLAVLVPAIGKVRGYRQILIWASSFLLILGLGLDGWAKYLNFVFPITIYCLTHTFANYKANVRAIGGLVGLHLPLGSDSHDN